MKFYLNGEERLFEQVLSIAQLLEKFSIQKAHIIVEVNQSIVQKEVFDETFLQENDSVELIAFMGGGENRQRDSSSHLLSQSLSERFKAINLYPVTCEKLSQGRSDYDVATHLIAGGAKVIQYRNKEASQETKLQMAKRLRKITEKNSVLFIINDDIDITMAVNADGVHLGQDDVGCVRARQLLGPDKIIGISCHSLEDVLTAQKKGATYANVGPIFETETKNVSVKPLGLETFAKIVSEVDLPLTVMGGIHEENLFSVLAAGATRIAMVSELVSASNISQKTEEILDIFHKYNKI